MENQLLLGDEAVALAALHAGIGGAFSYPGTPATEIFECIVARSQGDGRVSARWSANEKVAYEEALGMSYAGKRAIVSMKHVGLNVAADPFMNSALTGVNAGLVLAVADDPGMHSSQNEQDSRSYAEFAQIPLFEPCGQQEAYELTIEAFELSERLGLPVVVRLVTRLAHSRSNVRVHGSRERLTPPPRPEPDRRDWTLLPMNARRRYAHLLDLQSTIRENAEGSPHNRLHLAGPNGVIAAGLGWNYVSEVMEPDAGMSLLKLSVYPPPVRLIRQLIEHCDDVLIVEEGYPLIESRLIGLLGVPGKRIRGRRSGDLPPAGELTPDAVAAALTRDGKWESTDGRAGDPFPPSRLSAFARIPDLAGRPPQLCKGCPHADTFRAMIAAMQSYPRPILTSDIGCYTLGYAPEFGMVQTCVDMGASIAMAHGAAQAGAFPVVCTIGESTFTHSGMTPLIGAVAADADMTVLILDNDAVAMTGAQESLASGERLMELLRGLGVSSQHLKVIEPTPSRHRANVETIAREVSHRGLSVIVARRPCIQVKRKDREAVSEATPRKRDDSPAPAEALARNPACSDQRVLQSADASHGQNLTPQQSIAE